MSNPQLPIEHRVACPCCGYLTLSQSGAYEICELCNWEDDGQRDGDADVVNAGPNGGYSLSEARSNFRRYLVVYRPDHDMRATGPDTPTELQAKRDLIAAFDQLKGTTDAGERERLIASVQRWELVLEAELHKSVRALEDRLRAGGAA